MKVPLFIYGSGDLGRQCYDLVCSTCPSMYHIEGFIDDIQPVGTPIVDNVQVLGGLGFLAEPKLVATRPAILMAIGYNHLGIRFEKYTFLKGLGFKFPNLISPAANIAVTTSMGDGNIVLAGAILDHRVRIGNINYIDLNVTLSHNNTIDDNNFITAGTVTAGFVIVGSHNFIGIQSAITDKVAIGSHNFICARSLLTQSIDDKRRVVNICDQKIF